MIRRFVKLFTLFILVITTGIAWAQDVTISQFMANPLFTNPAFAGSNLGPRATVMYRNQWPNLHTSFESYSASYDQNLEPLNSGFGASFMSSKIGGNALVTATMSAYYAYHFRPNEDLNINLGVRGTYFQKRLNWTLVNSSVVFDTIKTMVGSGDGVPGTTVKNYDIAVGAIFTYKNTFGGFSADHLNTADISFFEGDSLTNLGMKMSFFAGAHIDIRKKVVRGTHYIPFIITPIVYYQGRTAFQQLSIGSYFSRGNYYAGGFYRLDFNNDAAIVVMLGATYKQFTLGYSFDYTLSSSKTFNGGAHELTLSFKLNNGLHERSRSMRLGPMPSPTF
jgi:type IX secretion system PorP/SprF family membrane protein